MPPDRFPLTFYREGCADRELTRDDVERAPIDESAMIVVTGTGLSHEPGRGATLFAAARAARAGVEVLVDLDYRADQWRARREDVAPFRITVLNVLGAGDAFASGLIAGLRRGWPLERAVRLANATGAIVVTRHGCANFMPSDAEVEAFVSEQGGW